MNSKMNLENKDHQHNIDYNELLQGNRTWVEETLKLDPDYFNNLAKGQHPPVLWIGCSDSRVPANQVTNTLPGEIFVHRNIANVVSHSDLNLLSVMDYAVNVLKVKYIIVAGHYQCGGVAAALSNKQFGIIDNWLRHIKDVYRVYKSTLDLISDPKEKENKLVEYNVIEGVYNVCKTTIVQNAWASGQEISVHGWVIDINTGLVKDLKVSVCDNDQLDNVYQFD
jgi:carbonic anhydrase